MQLSEIYVMNMRTLKGIVRYDVTWDEWEMGRQASLALPSRWKKQNWKPSANNSRSIAPAELAAMFWKVVGDSPCSLWSI